MNNTNASTVNVQLTPDEISILANYLSCEISRIDDEMLNSSHKRQLQKEFKKLYEKLNAFVLPISFSFEDEI